ncbi:MAG: hypothetical protein ACHP7G_04185 [Actinomycetales bacterium]
MADNDQHVDVAVVTHIDSDHIGGMVPLLGDDVARSMVRDVWFSGAPHLPAPVRERDRSVTQGEAVGTAILGSDGQRALPWNSAFGDAAIDVGDPGASCVSRSLTAPSSPSSRRPPSDSPPSGGSGATLSRRRPGRKSVTASSTHRHH